MKLINLVKTTIVVFILCHGHMMAQVAEQQFKLAESYEQGGDFKSALRLYEEIYQNNKQEKYFEPVVRLYKQQNRYDELKLIVEERLKNSKTAKLLILAGEVYWHVGQFQDANKIWEQCKAEYAKDPQTFLDIATVLVTFRDFEKVVQVLQEGKQKFNNNSNIVDELIRAYSQLNNYTEGFKELLYFLSLTKNLQQTQARLYNFLGNVEATAYMDNAFDIEIKKNRNDIMLLNLYSWFLRSNKNFEKAFNIVVELDSKQNTKGRTVYAFAEESRKDAQYDIALKAYQKVYEMGKNSPYSNNAAYYYIKTTEEKLINMSTENNIDTTTIKVNYQALIADYQKIIKDRPQTEFCEQSKLNIARIEYNIFNNFNEAISILNNVIQTKYSSMLVLQASNELSTIYLAQDSIGKAQKFISDIIKQFDRQKNNNDIKQQLNIAKFNLAEMLYYQSNIDSASIVYSELILSLDDDIANDAMMRNNFISQNKDFVKSLSLFSQAELFTIQKKYRNALDNFYEIVKLQQDETIAELALVKAAELEILLSNSKQAKELLTKYIADNVYPFYGDNALFILGNIMEKEYNTEAAIDYYGELLYKFPRSLLINEARNKIRILRKDKL